MIKPERRIFKASEIYPAKYNPRTITDKSQKGLKSSLDKFGYIQDVIVNIRDSKNIIVGGHQRFAAMGLSAADEIECTIVDLDEVEEKALNVALNSGEISGEWDIDKLGDILKDIQFEFPGFEDINLDDLAESLDIDFIGGDDSEEGAADDVPEVVAEPVIKKDDLIELGRHRVLCGDSTSAADVELLMRDEKADVCFTSPPYNAGCFGYDGGKSKYKKNQDDNLSHDDYKNFLIKFTDLAIEYSHILLINNQFLSGNRHALAEYIGHYALCLKEVFPWIKNTAPPNVNKGVFTNRFEIVLCLERDNSKKGFPVQWQGKYHNIIEGSTAAADNVTDGLHSATMPIYLPEWFFERLSYIKKIYDPFLGSGTTLIAAEKTKRKCYGMEIDPSYCQVIVQRWCDFTGNDKIKINGKQVLWSEYISNDY